MFAGLDLRFIRLHQAECDGRGAVNSDVCPRRAREQERYGSECQSARGRPDGRYRTGGPPRCIAPEPRQELRKAVATTSGLAVLLQMDSRYPL